MSLVPLRAGDVYSLEAFAEVTGMREAAVRRLRRQGLPIRRVGLRSFILGEDFADFVKEHGKILGPKGELNAPQ
jgi:hypothetical protein